MASILDSLIMYVELPKTVRIENRRLGGLHKILTVVILVYVCYSLFLARPFYVTEVPVHSKISLWSGAPTSGGTAAAKTHCTSPSTFDYSWDGSDNYFPRKCAQLPTGEHMWKLGNSMYIPTFIRDKYYTNGAVQWSSDFFVDNVETFTINFNHGYEVPKGSDVRRGQDVQQAVQTSSGGQQETVSGQEGKIRTVFQNANGGRWCSFGGVNQWDEENSRTGISGQLQDLLACAGVDLDAAQAELKNGGALETGNPTLRLAGMQLRLSMVYENTDVHSEDFDGVMCFVRVSAVPMWNSNMVVAYTTAPTTNSPTDPQLTGSYRYRYQFGVSLTLEATGRFNWFDFAALITAIVNAIVLLSVPTAVCKILALNFCGPASAVYQRVQSEPLGLTDASYGACARKMMAAHVFKQLAAEHEGKDGIEEEHLRKMLLECLQQVVADGILDKKEINSMASAMMEGMDRGFEDTPADAENGKKPTIALTEFVEACSIGEQVSTAELGALFDRDRTVGVLETLFTDGKMRALVGKAPVVRGAPLLEPAVELKEMGAEEAIPAPAAEAEAPAEDNQA